MVLHCSAEDESWRRGSPTKGVHPCFAAKGAERCSGFRGRYEVVVLPYGGVEVEQACRLVHDFPFGG